VSIVIGIDNGISGGLVAISAHHGLIIATTIMPSQKHRTRNEVDIQAVHSWISGITDGQPGRAAYIIEEPNNSRNASTAYSVAASFHSLRGYLEAYHAFYCRITPQSWQKAMLGKVPAGETKAYALAKAREIWPEESWLASPRSKVPHEGIVDSFLIAEHGRRHLLKNS
jgi:hypothetical protein